MEFLGRSDEYLHQTEIVVARLYKMVGSELLKGGADYFFAIGFFFNGALFLKDVKFLFSFVRL